MGYPISWRPRPSTGGAVAAVLPRGFVPTVTLPRFQPPRFTPGRHFPGLLLAGMIIDAAITRADYELKGGDAGLKRAADFDMTGWTLVCGPVGPPANHSYPLVNSWSLALPAGWPTPGVCGTGNQALTGEFDQMVGARSRYLWWTHATIADRYAVSGQWGRNPGAALAPAVMQPVVEVPTINTGVLGLTPAIPIAPAINRPLPLVLTPDVVDLGLPEGPYRGYFPPALPLSPPSDRLYSDRVVRAVPIGPDVKPAPWDPERKVPVNSRAGIALTQAFKLLSMYGTSEAFIGALWRALPSWARTPHARNGQKLSDLAANWGDIDLDDAFANSLFAAVRVAMAGALYGKATQALTEGFGQGPGFGLYRAWSTGEFAYSTGRGFEPYRVNRGGGSIAERQYNTDPGMTMTAPRHHAFIQAQRRRSRAALDDRVRVYNRRLRAQDVARRPELYKKLRKWEREWRAVYARGREARRRRDAWAIARGRF